MKKKIYLTIVIIITFLTVAAMGGIKPEEPVAEPIDMTGQSQNTINDDPFAGRFIFENH